MATQSIPALKAFMKTLPGDAARAAFASRCGTTIGHLRNVMYGQKPCSALLAVLIHRESQGAVPRWLTCPDDWHVIWPELIGTDGAPLVEAA